MKPLLEVSHLTHRYGATTALEDFSLVVMSGQHTVLTGPSGCGKSTALRLIAGLDTPFSGTIRIRGEPMTDGSRLVIPPAKRGLAMVFQDLALWPNLTALGNVELGLASACPQKGERMLRARQALTLCRISELADRRPAQLSGGQQQRVALARVLAVRPSLLLLDEPFTGMDERLKAQLISELRNLSQEHDVTILVATHDAREAEALGCIVRAMQDTDAPKV